MPRFIRLSIVVLLVLAVVAGLAWSVRRPLSAAAVDSWLGSRGVTAHYRITRLSGSSVTLADVALGDPKAPDFTAERVEADLAWAWSTPTFQRVRLLRPRLAGRIDARGLSFGSVDTLIPASPPGTLLPDIDVAVTDGRLQLATPAGPLNARVDGSGRLRDGFRARARLVPVTLRSAGCTAAASGGGFDVVLAPRISTVTGSGHIADVACPGRGRAGPGDWKLTASLPPSLDSYRAQLALTVASGAAAGYTVGTTVLTAEAASATLSGPIAGTFGLAAAAPRGPAGSARQASVNGSYRVDQGRLRFDGDVALQDASATLPLTRLQPYVEATAGTLAQPLLAALIARTAAAARAFDATAHLATTATPGELRVTRTLARGASGAMFAQTGAATIGASHAALDGGLTMTGGGLPAMRLEGSGTSQNGRFAGRATLTAARFAAGRASLDSLRLAAGADTTGVAIDGGIRVSGVLGGGIVAEQLGIPVLLRLAPGGGLRFGDRCLALDWHSLSRGTTRLAPGLVRLCPTRGVILARAGGKLGGGFRTAPLRLEGRDGASPLLLTSGPVEVALSGSAARPQLALRPAALTLGTAAGQLRATVAGRVDLAAASGDGTFAGLAVAAPALPARIDAASATWHWRGSRLWATDAAARIADRNTPARFEPLQLARVSAELRGTHLTARGELRLAAGNARLLGFTAAHDLASGDGSAALDSGRLEFGAVLQPYQISEALRGVVDNVRGPVIATGRVDWTGARLISRGTLKLDNLALATASLGPIDGISGTIVFDDLLALTTPPGQRLHIARINPGVAVDDGDAAFELLGPDAVRIEQLRWPYAGGTLTLSPVTLRTTDPRRILKLTVAGLDAQAFLQKFEIKNLNLTGRFDGTLPLLFEGGKGRIVGGTLVAQAGGGVLQYVGQLGGKDMGASAQLAFDALRRLRYRNLELELDGALDGELVTQLRFAGTNEATTTLGGGPLPIRATGLPFKFNIQVRAPFRALLGTAASFSDVRPLLRPVVPPVAETPIVTPPVQPR